MMRVGTRVKVLLWWCKAGFNGLLVESLDQVKRKEEEENEPTPSEQPQFIPIGDEHSCQCPADEGIAAAYPRL
jgi:hypothetical protein